MALPASYDSRDAAPEPLREHLIERDGKFFVEVEGMKGDADFTAFSDALKKRLADVTTELKSVRDRGLTKEDITKIVTEAAGGFRKPDDKGSGEKSQHERDMERELASLKESLTTLKTENEQGREERARTSIRADLITAATEAAPKPECLDTVVSLFASEFELSEAGETRSKVGCQFGSNLTPKEVMAKVKTDPRFPFWPPSKGSGAGSGDGGGAGGGDDQKDNPWSRKSWNRTAQAQAVRADPDKARKLAEAAGSSVGATTPPEK